jgi:c-di-GMP-binding flagellar brake protein YcgR
VSIDSQQTSLDGTTLDISLGGMLVQAERTFRPGTPVTTNLEIERGLAPLRSSARVVRVVGADCMGILLENLGPKESNRLQQFLLPLILAAS